MTPTATPPICMFVTSVSTSADHFLYTFVPKLNILSLSMFFVVCGPCVERCVIVLTLSPYFVVSRVFYVYLVVGYASTFVLSDTVSTLVTILNPRGIAFNPSASILYLTTPYEIMSMPFSASGVHPYPTILAGSGMQGFADGNGTAAKFYWPTGIAIHPKLGTL